METTVYRRYKKNSRTIIQWWWASDKSREPAHGPFESKDEAEDAARAARITEIGAELKQRSA